ncbi:MULTISPECIES: hypothetical protein [unclassified Modestobacter]|uniref:hypothetical protein n=1 Tax=unclassified Modestobacter TaxID=2643866 RepID=UPI0022AA5BB9|nr:MULTISPECIES: hypothetical protein [unclassified Modestobacter]MCZ2823257.1 hypothetical protein [Modestobacter sp. VKM Ac-2981]MCZ2851502.1 hypothetical protein [Modestobacter sp. VKM Ac-2982]
MSTSSDDQPTKVLPQTTAEPPAHAAPATRRTPGWPSSVPAHIGRFRTSSVVLGVLFVVLFVLNLLLPQPDSGTSPVVLPSGETIAVPNSLLPSDARTTTTPTPTSTPTAPSSEVPTEDEEPVTTPSRPTTRAPASTPTPTRAPSPTTATTEEEPTDDETTESEPTPTTADETTADPTD